MINYIIKLAEMNHYRYIIFDDNSCHYLFVADDETIAIHEDELTKKQKERIWKTETWKGERI